MTEYIKQFFLCSKNTENNVKTELTPQQKQEENSATENENICLEDDNQEQIKESKPIEEKDPSIKYIEQMKIGSGSYCTVYKNINVNTKQLVAIKKYHNKERGLNELQIYKHIQKLDDNNKYIVKFLEFYYSHIFTLHLILEFCPRTLEDLTISLTEDQLKPICIDVTKGLEFLHNVCKIIHFDIKPGNILLKDGIWKISDFNLSKKLSDKHITKMRGTPLYIAPEVAKLEFDKLDTKIDIWSFGILICMIYFEEEDALNNHPFRKNSSYSISELFSDIKYTNLNFKKYKTKKSISENLENLLSHMLEKKPTNRYNINQVLSHSFIVNHS